MKTFFKVGGFEFGIQAHFTKEQPVECARWGRIDIPNIKGYFFIMLRLEYHRWFVHWVKRYCIYWEV